MVEVRGHHHPVPGGVGQLRALGRDALGHRAPGAVLAHRATVSRRLELGQALHLHPAHHKRRINTEKTAKVVAAVWET